MVGTIQDQFALSTDWVPYSREFQAREAARDQLQLR